MSKMLMNPKTGSVATESEWREDFAITPPEEWGNETFEDAGLVEARFVVVAGSETRGPYDLEDAQVEAADWAEALSIARAYGEEYAVETTVYENGSLTAQDPPTINGWECGACPEGDDGAYWPHVKFDGWGL